MLLDELNIQYQSSDQEFMQLENLLWLMKKQSETCLQGVSLIVFKALKAGLEAQQGKQLDVKLLWRNNLIYLREKLQNRKPNAFLDIGRFLTLEMISNYQIIIQNNNEIADEYFATSEIIFGAINQHFYFFGQITDEIVIPFGYDGSTLILNGLPYTNCSHFKLLFDNLFMCLAMWLGFGPLLDLEESNNYNYNYVSVTSIYSLYISKNINAKKNE